MGNGKYSQDLFFSPYPLLKLVQAFLKSQDTLNSNCGHRSFTIPASISPGAYLVRAEAIVLHAAQSAGGAQFYMSCYQVNITGGGAASPAGVSFPGAYKATDPGILIDIYKPITDYVIPGPAVFAE
jgi:cellulase